MKRLDSERLFLRPANLEDGPFIYKLLNSDSWLRYFGDKNIVNLNKAEAYIENSLIKGYNKNGFGLLVVSLMDGTQIGLCGFLKRDYLEGLDLGFALLPSYEGFGYAFEATSAMIQFGKTELNLSRVLAICMEANKRSLQLLFKLGFKKVDTVKLTETSEELLMLST
ncbi:GNAT family N-acetyltransferase [Maribacter hydrothermalis]|uniref:GCN5 family acetyltransferase n=1 Tax=Maribacter hydrothermalis TaxID=1836467 RepID=A0A1B7Z3H6_9FLAO|nr:GNAT family N-acetyltransferase [Maribacter hydrothermalis]APQ17020.1 GNAT family N-acetyltransferase [Maribacter hydrothermalis]OBR37281.1 GCN5 family acetyltransferase [Maribacter hydrothermalis]